MRTETINICQYSELSESAREKAFHSWLSKGDYGWEGDNENTLDTFTGIFPVKVKSFEYGYRDYINFSFTADDDIEGLSGLRLVKHIHNNYYDSLFKGKYYSKGKYSRTSKILVDNCCSLTGFHMDNAILQPIYDFLKKPTDLNFKDLMEDCLESWVSACSKDYEAYMSKENFSELCEINGWEFTEDGKWA